MSCRRLLLVAAIACLAAAGFAQNALAVGVNVRVEASSETVAPVTAVNVGTATFYDSSGTPYATATPNALAALAKTADARGFTWEASYAGSFVNNIAGFTSLADWSQGWIFAVNGVGYPLIDVSAIDFPLATGDDILWAQTPDSTFARGSCALVVETGKTAFTTGDTLTVTVLADDLAKVDSQADYDRYGLSDETLLETPEEFATVAGATVHVGSATYTTGDDGTVTIASPNSGTSRIWAEKDMDATTVYFRSEQALVNVADELALSDVSVAPATFLPGTQKPKISYTLSRAARVVIQVRTSANKTVWAKTLRRGEGTGSYTWNGRTQAGAYVKRHATYAMRVRAVDTWGRTTAWSTLTLKTR